MKKPAKEPEVRRGPAVGDGGRGLSRRDMIKRLGTGAAAAAVSPAAAIATLAAGRAAGEAEAPLPPHVRENVPPGPVEVELRINGIARKVTVEPRTTLLSALRDRLDLTGAKMVCDRGSCGGCTVLVGGAPVYSCLMLALDARGREIRTIEGLSGGGALDPVQQAFIDKDALMCGYCTPGMILSVRALLDRHPRPTLDDVRRATAGNLCRCGTYPKVFEAAMAAATSGGGGGGGGKRS